MRAITIIGTGICGGRDGSVFRRGGGSGGGGGGDNRGVVVALGCGSRIGDITIIINIIIIIVGGVGSVDVGCVIGSFSTASLLANGTETATDHVCAYER